MVDSYYCIMDRFVVTLDKTKLSTQYTDVKNAVYNDMVAFRNYVYGWVDSFKDTYPEVYLELSEGIKCQDVSDNDNKLSVTIEFKNTYCFGMFYGIVTLDEGEYLKAMEDKGPFVSKILLQDYKTEEMGLFLYKYSMVSTANFLDSIEDYNIEGIGTNYYSKYNELIDGYSLSDISVSQVFAYPDDRIYANADEKEIVDGFTFLYWNLSDKDENFEMSIYKIAPEVAAWYVLGLIISVVAVVVLFIVLKTKQKSSIDIKITKKEAEKDE